MSTLQVSNLHFESTGNNRLQYTGSNAYNLVAGGITAAVINTTSFYANLDFDVAGTFKVNNSDISTIGKHTIWVPASAMTPTTTNGAGTQIITVGDVNVQVLAFDAATSEFASFAIQMPKSWNEGSVIFQPVWAHPAATNFGVYWDFNARAYSNDDTPAAYISAVNSIDTGGTTNDIYIGPETDPITIDGTPAAEDLVVFRVWRVASQPSDTMEVDAYLYGVKIHYTIDAARDD